MASLSFKALAALLAAGALCGAASAANNQSDYDHGIYNPNHCKIVERKPDQQNAGGGLSTSVTAGNGHVSAHTSGGNGVTVQSGNGSVSSSVATTGSGNGTTTVTTSDGDCIIYVNPGQKKGH